MRTTDALRQFAANIRAFDLPSARLYDALFGPLLASFYERAAQEVAAACPSGRVLEIGSGPGRVGVRLAQLSAGLQVIGVDISPQMVAIGNRRAAAAGLRDRVRFQVADAVALPFAPAQFDCATSTFSLHHWPDPARGLAEIHRVLKPAGQAWIYDLAQRLLRHALSSQELARLAAQSPFGGASLEKMLWPGPLPAINRLRLHH